MNNTIQLYLHPADRVIVPKSEHSMVRHHGIYWGQDAWGQHWFIHNHVDSGVQYITAENFLQGAPVHRVRVQHFVGNMWQRQHAISRAVSMLNRPYDLFGYNCEHYSNEVQNGKPESKQVGAGLAIVGLAICVFGAAAALK